jgi:hypothetical protein
MRTTIPVGRGIAASLGPGPVIEAVEEIAFVGFDNARGRDSVPVTYEAAHVLDVAKPTACNPR